MSRRRVIEDSSLLAFSRMYKKSQNRNTVSRENFKCRYFLLFPSVLKYCSGDPEKLKDKGFVLLKNVVVVECVSDYALNGQVNSLQIVYNENDTTQFLYIIASSKEERDEWIDQIKKACEALGVMFRRDFHPGAWTKTKNSFSCCGKQGREAPGCEIIPSRKHSSASLSSQRSTPQPGRSIQARRNREVPDFTPPPPPVTPDANIYMAIYNYTGAEHQDLSLKKDKEYEIIDKANEHWWFARDVISGQTGYLPSNYVTKKHTLETMEWFHKDISRTRVDELLRQDGRVGAFIIRDSISQPGAFTLSTFTGESDNPVRHYHIKQTADGKYYIVDKHIFDSIVDLVHYHSMNAAGQS